MSNSFISSFIDYTSGTEVPTIFSRWAAIVGLGAYLGRQCWIPHGHWNIYPNMYCMLLGSPGARKGTAIKLVKKLLSEAGYNDFSAEKTSKEKFLFDLAGEDVNVKAVLEDVWGTTANPNSDHRQVFVAIDEINDFIGLNNIEFISLLGNLWDYSGSYPYRRQTGKSILIPNPTISILGGNTPVNFSLAFPSEILGQGFFSRLLLIHGEPNGQRITFPPAPNPIHTRSLVESLIRIRKHCVGGFEITSGAKRALESIYAVNFGPADVRFETYTTRRFTHLLKLCLCISASAETRVVHERDVIHANTILHYAEQLMPKALGQFGKAKHSGVRQKIITLLENADRPLTLKELWKHVHNDMEKMRDLADLLLNLAAADELQSVNEGSVSGFLIKRATLKTFDPLLVDYSFLTEAERMFTS